jgi:hypothetical protein
LLSGLVRTLPELSLTLARRLSALDVHYPPLPDAALLHGLQPAAGAHPLVGTRVAAAAIPDGRPLVTDRSVIRPDGYIWWATDGDENPPDLGVTFRD